MQKHCQSYEGKLVLRVGVEPTSLDCVDTVIDILYIESSTVELSESYMYGLLGRQDVLLCLLLCSSVA